MTMAFDFGFVESVRIVAAVVVAVVTAVVASVAAVVAAVAAVVVAVAAVVVLSSHHTVALSVELWVLVRSRPVASQLPTGAVAVHVHH